MTLVLELLHSPLDLLIQLLQLFYVVLKFIQQPITEERKTVNPELHTGLNDIHSRYYSGGVIGYHKVKSVPLNAVDVRVIVSE